MWHDSKNKIHEQKLAQIQKLIAYWLRFQILDFPFVLTKFISLSSQKHDSITASSLPHTYRILQQLTYVFAFFLLQNQIFNQLIQTNFLKCLDVNQIKMPLTGLSCLFIQSQYSVISYRRYPFGYRWSSVIIYLFYCSFIFQLIFSIWISHLLLLLIFQSIFIAAEIFSLLLLKIIFSLQDFCLNMELDSLKIQNQCSFCDRFYGCSEFIYYPQYKPYCDNFSIIIIFQTYFVIGDIRLMIVTYCLTVNIS